MHHLKGAAGLPQFHSHVALAHNRQSHDAVPALAVDKASKSPPIRIAFDEGSESQSHTEPNYMEDQEVAEISPEVLEDQKVETHLNFYQQDEISSHREASADEESENDVVLVAQIASGVRAVEVPLLDD